MTQHPFSLKQSFIGLCLFFLCISLAACKAPLTPQAENSTPTAAQATEVPVVPTATLIPPHGQVILVAPPEADALRVEAFKSVLADLAQGANLDFKVLPGLQKEEITPQVRVVVGTSLLNNLPDLLAAAPQVQFIMVSSGDVGASPNMTIIHLAGERQSFIGGMLAETIAPDWRAAGLFSPDEPQGSSMEDAFRRGAGYFCGICNPVNGPVVRFPLTARLSAIGDAGVFQPVIEELRQKVINVVYVDPASSSPELLTYLAEQGLTLIGGQTPPVNVQARWAATVQLDPALVLKTVWDDVLGGKGGKTVYASLKLDNINPELLSPGRQALVEKTIQDLESGAIYPFSVPLQ
jgi:hypothetical protein